jgi:2-dehydropantoate 2-reductase
MPSDDPTAAAATTSSPARVLAPRRQSVAVVGSGAVGGFYGVRLWEAGHRVYFHVRGRAELEQVRREGFRLESSVHAGATIPPDLVRAHGSPSEMAQALRREAEEEEAGAPAGGASASEASPPPSSSFDWVVVALKSSSLESVPALIEPLLDPRKTRVLVIMNGLVEDDLIALLKRHFREAQEEEEVQAGGGGGAFPGAPPLACCRALYGGMAFLCSNRLGPGRVSHTYAGRLSVGVASSSRRRGGGDDSESGTPAAADDEEDEQDDPDRIAVEELWRGVIPEVPLSWEPSLLAGRWRKNVWNLAFNGLSTAMGGWTVDLVVRDPSLRRLASDIMDETIAAGNADLIRRYGKREGERHAIEPEYKQVLFDLTDKMGPYKTSTMLDLANRRPMEVKYLFQEPVRRARELGVPVPRLGAVVAQIEALQRRHGL